MVHTGTGTLYIVATPIGNLQDISQRAIAILQQVDCLAAEDTRRTHTLLQHLGITQEVLAYHNFNEHERTSHLVNKLLSGLDIALVSDAGTPLISDPGYLLVREARAQHIPVIPIPGPCALTTALCASGLPSEQFFFAGFLPAKATARNKALTELKTQTATLIFYESPHRLMDSLIDMQTVLGDRSAVLAKELTKTFERFISGNLSEIYQVLEAAKDLQKGEFVVMIAGNEQQEDTSEAYRILSILLETLPVKQAASLAAQITGVNKNELYDQALKIKNN